VLQFVTKKQYSVTMVLKVHYYRKVGVVNENYESNGENFDAMCASFMMTNFMSEKQMT
jgi:hypothetical protein